MIEISRPEVLAQFTTFYDVSVLCTRFSKVEMRQCGVSGFKELSSMLSNQTVSKWELMKGGNLLDISFYCLKMISGLGDTLSGRLCLLNDICELSTK